MDWNCRLDPSLPPWRVIKPGMLCPGHFAQLKIKQWGGGDVEGQVAVEGG